jgi:aminoglycoside phosphotransferase (APT) family kinase protein
MTATPPQIIGEPRRASTFDRNVIADGGTVSRAPAPALIGGWLNSSPDAARLSARARWTVKGPLSSSTTSDTYRATCPGAPTLFLKRPGPGADSATAQYEVLVKARERLADNTRVRVPTAYPFLLERGFLVTEWIEGPAVSHLLHGLTTRPQALLRSLQQAGGWLRGFHRLPTETHTFINTDKLINDTRAAITELNGWRAAPDVYKNYLALLERTSPVVDKITVPVGPLHGDFKPANVIISRGEAVAIDISASFSGDVINDLVQFLFHLDLELFEPRGFRLLPWGHTLEAAFLQGYDRDEVVAPRVVLAWCRLQRALGHHRIEMKNENNRARGMLRKVCYALCAERIARHLRRVWEEPRPLL